MIADRCCRTGCFSLQWSVKRYDIGHDAVHGCGRHFGAGPAHYARVCVQVCAAAAVGKCAVSEVAVGEHAVSEAA